MKELSVQLEGRVDTLLGAVAEFNAKIASIERHVASQKLVDYPDKKYMEQVASVLRGELGAQQVEINSISNISQTTVAAAPSLPNATIPASSSLCVMTVALGEAVAVTDIDGDAFLEGHATQDSKWGSWASAPIVIDGQDAGSICALETHPRSWTDGDQARLEHTSAMISTEISTWTSRRSSGSGRPEPEPLGPL